MTTGMRVSDADDSLDRYVMRLFFGEASRNGI